MMNQFIISPEQTRFFISESEGRNSILGRNEDDGRLLNYQNYRIALRAISSSTNTRTLIATILPKKTFVGNSLLVSTSDILNSNLLYIVSFINSFVLDYYIRQIVSQNINIFYIYQLPIPRLGATDKWYKLMIEKAAKLVCSTPEFADLWKEVMQSEWSQKSVAITEPERNRLKADLDGIIAYIYGLTEEEFTHILSTFPIVPLPQKVAAHNAFRDVVNGIIK